MGAAQRAHLSASTSRVRRSNAAQERRTRGGSPAAWPPESGAPAVGGGAERAVACTWGNRRRSCVKRWMKNTEPLCAPTTPRLRARSRCHANSVRTGTWSILENRARSTGRRERRAQGKVRTHWRQGTGGSRRSTRSTAVSAARRDQQLGHMRPLQLNATRRSSPQDAQRRRAKPLASSPQSRYRRSSPSAKRGRPLPPGSASRAG
jgi:hypothetical protein